MHCTFPYIKLKVSLSYWFGQNVFAGYFDPKPEIRNAALCPFPDCMQQGSYFVTRC